MIPSPYHFRFLMLLSLFCGVATLCLTFLFPGLVPEPIRLADEQLLQNPNDNDSLAWLVLQFIFFVGLLVASIIGFIGLFLFKAWARLLNVVLCFSLFAVWPAIGYNVSSGWAQAFSDFGMLLWGAVIALSYFSSLSARFATHER